jgi:hypothetical protein
MRAELTTERRHFVALVDWVENKVPPQSINAQNTAGGVVTRSRPLCPYP